MAPGSDILFKGMDTSKVGMKFDAIGSVNTMIGTRVKDIRKLGGDCFQLIVSG